MALSKLEVGQEVMVLKSNFCSRYDIGTIGTVIDATPDHRGLLRVRVAEDWIASIRREKILCVGDKVTRGPDWDNRNAGDTGRPNGVGVVIGFKNPKRIKGFDVRVDWPHRNDTSCRMTPDHQDLKPTGDSVDTGDSVESKDDVSMTPEEMERLQVGDFIIATEGHGSNWKKHDVLAIIGSSVYGLCFKDNNGQTHDLTKSGSNIRRFKVKGRHKDECSQYNPTSTNNPKEGDMAETNKQKARNLDTAREELQKQMSIHTEEYEEKRALDTERVEEMMTEAADLRLYKTTKEKKLALLKRLKKLKGQDAEDYLALKDMGVEVDI